MTQGILFRSFYFDIYLQQTRQTLMFLRAGCIFKLSELFTSVHNQANLVRCSVFPFGFILGIRKAVFTVWFVCFVPRPIYLTSVNSCTFTWCARDNSQCFNAAKSGPKSIAHSRRREWQQGEGSQSPITLKFPIISLITEKNFFRQSSGET